MYLKKIRVLLIYILANDVEWIKSQITEEATSENYSLTFPDFIEALIRVVVAKISSEKLISTSLSNILNKCMKNIPTQIMGNMEGFVLVQEISNKI